MQLTSGNGRVRAAVDPLGGGLRELEVDGIAIVESYPEGQTPPYAAGEVLFPWPNRVRDGRWSDEGTEQQLVISETELNNASHGLVRGRRFGIAHRAADALTLRTEVKDSPGYPFHLQLELEYQVLADGLQVQSRVRNLGSRRAPFGIGFHPYLRVGEAPTSELTLQIAAAEVLEVDDQLIPVGSHPVAGTAEDPNDLPLATAVLNHAYGGLTAADGQHRHRLQAAAGKAVEMRTDPAFGWVQVYTCPIYPRPGGLVTAVAVEPMTAPPNALVSGRDLIRLEPESAWSAGWSVHLI
jgi:aldose 1-epimerase